MKIGIIGLGYVGLSNAILLSQHNHVVGYDINASIIELLNKRNSHIKDKEINEYLKEKDLDIVFTNSFKEATEEADYIIISTPTNYDEDKNYFDTNSVESSIDKVLNTNDKCAIIIKSTIPVGFTEEMRNKFKTNRIIFSPEFLREGKALYDNLYPSRIIVGSKDEKAKEFANLLKEGALKENIDMLFVGSAEAEAIKLFANTYLALRVAYFNELDTYAEMKGLNTQEIIDGISLDPRIGNHYNNPSFGYGGYCLPKDTKQLLANYKDVPQTMIKAVVESNKTRKKHIVDMVMEKKPKTVGIYRLTMKTDSDNFRTSAIQDIINQLSCNNVDIIIYEPTLEDNSRFKNHLVVNNIKEFKKKSDIILANRNDHILEDSKFKVYTRDLYRED